MALVSYSGALQRNQAVPREQAGQADCTPGVLGVAFDQWLRRGRHAWIDVCGRRIQGLATARELAIHPGATGPARAWEIDTLVIGARRSGVDAGEIAATLLEQAAHGALSDGAGRILLRLHTRAPALEAATRAGFEAVTIERLWTGSVPPGEASTGGRAAGAIRELTSADAHAEFTLYHQAAPAETRQALAMTFEEWAAVQERRWLGKHAVELGLFEADRLRAVLRATRDGRRCLFTLDAAPDAEEAAVRLVGVLGDLAAGAEQVQTLAPVHAGAVEHALAAARFTAGDEYVLLCRRLAQPIRLEARAKTQIVVTG